MQRDEFLTRVREEIVQTDAWEKIAKQALRQKCQEMATRAVTHRYEDVGELRGDQARYQVLVELLADPAKFLTPREER